MSGREDVERENAEVPLGYGWEYGSPGPGEEFRGGEEGGSEDDEMEVAFVKPGVDPIAEGCSR